MRGLAGRLGAAGGGRPAPAAYDALQALLPGYTAADAPRLRPLLAHAHSDVRTAAAWALLAIDARSARP